MGGSGGRLLPLCSLDWSDHIDNHLFTYDVKVIVDADNNRKENKASQLQLGMKASTHDSFR